MPHRQRYTNIQAGELCKREAYELMECSVQRASKSLTVPEEHTHTCACTPHPPTHHTHRHTLTHTHTYTPRERKGCLDHSLPLHGLEYSITLCLPPNMHSSALEVKRHVIHSPAGRQMLHRQVCLIRSRVHLGVGQHQHVQGSPE